MRWLGLFRRRREDLVAATAASERPKLWAEIALPPPLETATSSPSEEPVVDALAPALAGTRSTVRLGFADGTSVEVDNTSAESDALRATASRIFGLVDN